METESICMYIVKVKVQTHTHTHTLITRGIPTGIQAMCHQNFYVGSHDLLFRTSYHGEQQNGRTGMRLGHTTNSVFGAKQKNVHVHVCCVCSCLYSWQISKNHTNELPNLHIIIMKEGAHIYYIYLCVNISHSIVKTGAGMFFPFTRSTIISSSDMSCP